MDPVRIGRGRRRVAYQIDIPASPEDVFALVGDPRRHHEIDGSGTVQSKVTAPDHLDVGSKFSVAMKMGPFPYSITSVVTAYSPNRLIEWRHPQGHRWRYELTKVDAGTHLIEQWNYSTAFWPWTLELAGFPKRNARGIRQTLAGLRRKFGG